MIELILFVSFAIVVSFYCSLLESVFLSITPAYVQAYKSDHPKLGNKLLELKSEVDRPLAAILSLNTVAHTIGATAAGAQATIVFGSYWIGLFSVVLTLAILIFSEVIPKTLGAIHWRKMIGLVTMTLPVLIVITYPLVWISVQISAFLRHEKPRQVMRNEIQALAELGEQEGAINKDEFDLISSMLKFRDVKVDAVMTPISVVSSVSESETIKGALEMEIPFSRIPVYKDNPKKLTGYLLKDDLHNASLEDQDDRIVATLKRSMLSLSPNEKLPIAIKQFSEVHGHIAVVENADGEATGIVTLEDAVEALLGWEIVDEFDPVSDMRELAEETKGR